MRIGIYFINWFNSKCSISFLVLVTAPDKNYDENTFVNQMNFAVYADVGSAHRSVHVLYRTSGT